MRRLLLPVALVLLAVAAVAQARIVEEQVDVPVTVKNLYGKEVTQSLKVTIWSDDRNPRPAPVLVFNHGRAPKADERAAMGRARYSAPSKFFVERGFIVVVPTRIGYGVTGGEDVEDTGDCGRKNYAPGYAAAADEALAALAEARKRPDAAQDRAVIVGQSFGGMTSAALAARNPPGVQLAINFAGGGGGDPKNNPQRPCAPQKLESLYADYGKVAKVPMLWIYTENDMFFGPRYPREWFAAFTQAGGNAEFEQFPPHGDDGHQLFVKFPEVWQPRVATFLDTHGYPAPRR